MIQTAVTDIVSPSVSAESPYGFLYQEVLQLHDSFTKHVYNFIRCAHVFDRVDDLVALCSGFSAVILVFQPFFDRFFQLFIDIQFHQSFHVMLDFFSHLFCSQQHTVTILSVVFKQRICPCRTSAVLILAVRHGWSRCTPDGRTSCCVSDQHTIAEQLCYQFDIRSFTASGTST